MVEPNSFAHPPPHSFAIGIVFKNEQSQLVLYKCQNFSVYVVVCNIFALIVEQVQDIRKEPLLT